VDETGCRRWIGFGLFALVVVAVSVLIDLVSAAIDPRIRY